jgi:uncharacterized membrane protein
MKGVKQRFKIVAFTTAAFAACGFLICWILLAYSIYARAHHQVPNEKMMLSLCPASMLSLGLDNASVLLGLLGWLLFGFMNAIRYAIPGFIIGLLIAVICPRHLLGLSKT